MKADKIISVIEKKAPLELQEEWDNSGWQIKAKNDLKKVLVALEIRSDVIDEAIEKGCDLIVTHHPMAFKDELGEVNDNIVTAKHRERLSHAYPKERDYLYQTIPSKSYSFNLLLISSLLCWRLFCKNQTDTFRQCL